MHKLGKLNFLSCFFLFFLSINITRVSLIVSAHNHGRLFPRKVSSLHHLSTTASNDTLSRYPISFFSVRGRWQTDAGQKRAVRLEKMTSLFIQITSTMEAVPRTFRFVNDAEIRRFHFGGMH